MSRETGRCGRRLGSPPPRWALTLAGLLAGALALVVGTAGCTDKGPSRAPVADRPAGGPVTFVVMGDQRATAGQTPDALHQTWPQLMFTRSLPRRAVYVNLASDGATVADARRAQVGAAHDLKPTVVAVWLGKADSQQATSQDRFEARLGALVDDLRRAAADPGPPPATKLRVLLVAADPYVDAVKGAARDHDAEVVDVHGVDADSGDARSQQQVADAVSKVLGPQP